MSIANHLWSTPMKSVKKMYERMKVFCIAYPAVVSGFFIYSYLFFCILQYFFKLKSSSLFHSPILTNIVESFDAFPFMWLLSVALVKVIEVRTELHKSEEKRIFAEREKQLHQSQLKTLQEVTRGVQHHVNNPLAIISLAVAPARKAAGNNQKVLHQLNIIDEAVKRMITALEDFSKIREYTVESGGPIVGDIVTPNVKQ
jgi:signal transduction histidine kinase